MKYCQFFSPFTFENLKLTVTDLFFLHNPFSSKYWVKNYFAHGSFPEVVQKQKTEKKILQGLWVAQAAVTERWP